VKTPAQETTIKSGFKIKARQIVGQPAGPGIATGKARVILDDDKLFDFKAGEVLVCDAIDPNMTFVVPLAAAIVERRGGMLIHGAIIAREYGIPCVTGIPGATELISSGDQITVDGYLGIVVIGQERK
jgi:pyruvate,water dikinase